MSCLRLGGSQATLLRCCLRCWPASAPPLPQERFPQCVYKPGEDVDCKETDSGAWLKGEIKRRLKDVDCKYIDPSCEGKGVLTPHRSRQQTLMQAGQLAHMLNAPPMPSPHGWLQT